MHLKIPKLAVKIISHNVYWFQGHPFSESCPGAPNQEILRRLCTLYREKEAAILCLQEIQSEDVAMAVAAEMQMDVLYTPGAIHAQYGSMIATSLRSPFRLPNGAPTILERSLVAARVPLPSGTLGVTSIHLTSGRQTSPAEAKAARVREISEFLTSHGVETDILAGDFNEDPDGEVAGLLRARGFVDTASVFGKASIGASVSGTRRRDLIWVKAKWQSRLLDYGVVQEELAVSDLKGKSFLSDHRPVWITLEA